MDSANRQIVDVPLVEDDPEDTLLTQEALTDSHGADLRCHLAADGQIATPMATDRLQAVRLEFDAQLRRFEQARAGLQEIIEQMERDRPNREILRHSAFARLQARLDSMPVIEQAKGVLMAQQHCGPDQAFDLLRRASQRANIKVSVLAAQIVEQVASQPGNPSAAKSAGMTSDARPLPRGQRPDAA